MNVKYVVEIEPMGAVRMTQRGKWTNQAAQRYLSYKSTIGWDLKSRGYQPTSAACSVIVTFYMPIPKSWSMKKQREHENRYHTKKPDIDNLVKGLFDAANGVIWKDDNQVVHCEARKAYSDRPRIEIDVLQVKEEAV